MTRMSDRREAAREELETMLTGLGTTRAEIKIARVRVRQAIERFPALRPLLGPVYWFLAEWEGRLGRALYIFQQYWVAHEAQDWQAAPPARNGKNGKSPVKAEEEIKDNW